jgi:hypothetical protein
MKIHGDAASIVGAVVVRVNCGEATAGTWNDLKEVLVRHKGRVPVLFELESDGVLLRCSTSNGHTVQATEQLAAELEQVLSPGAVRFELELHAVRDQKAPWKNGRSGRRA